MKLLRNYFSVFLICLFISIFAKFIFAFYSFADIELSKKVYAIFYGYKFDFAVSAMIACLTLFFDFNKKLLLVISSFLLILLFGFLIGDIMYFNDANRHITYEVKDVFAESAGLVGTVWQKYLDLFIFSIISLVILGVIFFKLLNLSLNTIKFSKSYIPIKLLLIVISVFFVRGMFQKIPLSPDHVYQIGDAKLATLSLNSAYNVIYKNIKSKGNIVITKAYKVNNEKQKVKDLYINQPQILDYKKDLKQPNIVLFFLESWGASFFKDYGGPYDIVPRFSKILTRSIRPKGMIANGHRTVEGIFSTLTSYQNPLGKSIIRTSLESLEYTSLVELLKKQNYSTAFFQGFYSETSAGIMAQKLGFERSYGKQDIKDRQYEENHWGVHDPDLYKFTFEKTKELKQPFIIGINTTTTHDDVLPKGYPIRRFVEDDALNEILNTFYMSDEATFDFVDKMEKAYPNTIFVFLADHTSRVPEDTNFHNYLIPFAIYSPKLPPKYIDEFISQRDIAPTITDLVLGDYQKIAPEFSGKSLLRENHFFADYYHNGVLGVVKDKVAIEVMDNQINCFNVAQFKLDEMSCSKKHIETINQIKAFTNIQQKLLFDGKTKEFSKYR